MQSRLFILLLKPSLLSGILTILATTLIIGALNWPYFTYIPALYPILYGDFGVVTALEQSPALTEGIQNSFNSNPIIYGAIVIIAAVLAGWGALLLVRGIKGSAHTVEALENANERRGTLQQIGERLGVLVIWIIYAIISVTIIFPFCLLLSRIGADIITSAQGILMNIAAFILLALAIHLHVIFLRLLLLRPRAFGGKAAVEDAAFYYRT